MIRSRKISFSLLIFRLLVVFKSISKCVFNEDHVDSVGMSGESGDQELAADCIRRFAVKALTGFLTGGLHIKPLCIDRSSHISCALHGTVKIITYLIHSNNKDHLLRSLGNAGYAIGIAINIDKNSIIRDCICTG